MGFDPNRDIGPIYATYIKERRPKFKLHDRLGYATAALKWRAKSLGGRAYEVREGSQFFVLKDGKWKELEFDRFYEGQERIKIKKES